MLRFTQIWLSLLFSKIVEELHPVFLTVQGDSKYIGPDQMQFLDNSARFFTPKLPHLHWRDPATILSIYTAK